MLPRDDAWRLYLVVEPIGRATQIRVDLADGAAEDESADRVARHFDVCKRSEDMHPAFGLWQTDRCGGGGVSDGVRGSMCEQASA